MIETPETPYTRKASPQRGFARVFAIRNNPDLSGTPKTYDDVREERSNRKGETGSRHVGIQKKITLNGLLWSWLAAENIEKSAITKIQNGSEKRVSTNKPSIAAIPVAFEPLNSGQCQDMSSAMIIAASTLRMPLK